MNKIPWLHKDKKLTQISQQSSHVGGLEIGSADWSLILLVIECDVVGELYVREVDK